MRKAFAFFVVILTSLHCLAADPAPVKDARQIYREQLSSKMVPLLTEVVHFQTVKGNSLAREQQQAWLKRVGTDLGFTVRDAGPVTEVELPGPKGAPILGLMVHGDVQPVSESEWTTPPFEATADKKAWIYGRGVVDDKGPLVEALLAMKAFQLSGVQRTQTIRLLVGSDEESDNLDVTTYLKTHTAPYLTLVLDCFFPVVVGEKGWVEFTQTVADPYRVRSKSDALFAITNLDAGISTSIVPSHAAATLHWLPESPIGFDTAVAALRAEKPPEGIGYKLTAQDRDVTIDIFGRAAHAGMNLAGGRNALVALANLLYGVTARSGATSLLEFAREAGSDLHGEALGIAQSDPIWGSEDVNVATIKPDSDKLKMAINIRHIPPMSVEDLQTQLRMKLDQFNAGTGSSLEFGGFFKDTPTVFNLNAKIVKRLMSDYQAATGLSAKPAVSGGGTYAKRLPNAIAYGMWFNNMPYPGHTSNEGMPITDLHKGVDVLIYTLNDLATKPPIDKPLEP